MGDVGGLACWLAGWLIDCFCLVGFRVRSEEEEVFKAGAREGRWRCCAMTVSMLRCLVKTHNLRLRCDGPAVRGVVVSILLAGR
jgi:hypothetical protein